MGLFSRRRGPSGKATTEAEARAIATIALACAGADGHIDQSELAETAAVAARLPAFQQINGERFMAMLQEIGQHFAKRGVGRMMDDAKRTLSPELRKTAFFMAVRVANADGTIEDSEQTFLAELARHLELPNEVSVQLFADAVVNNKPAPGSAAKAAPQPKAPPPDPRKEDQTARFDAYVLLSEPLQFTTAEIRSALLEDFPQLQIEDAAPLVGEMRCDTAEFVTAPLIMGQAGEDACLTTLIRIPGYGTWDVATLRESQKRLVPDLDHRMTRNASYVCVSVSAKSKSLTDAFRAARLSSCLAAVFSRLPVALAVYWEGADHFLTPEQVLQMADDAVADDWPCMSWLSLDVQSGPSGDAVLTQVLSKGLADFLDYELVHTFAPVDAQTAASKIMAASWMALQGGHSFTDGDTLGEEGQSKDASYRLRFVPKDVFGSPTDLVALVHPNGAFDADKALGRTTSRPAPDGATPQVRSEPGFFKRMMGGAARAN